MAGCGGATGLPIENTTLAPYIPLLAVLGIRNTWQLYFFTSSCWKCRSCSSVELVHLFSGCCHRHRKMTAVFAFPPLMPLRRRPERLSQSKSVFFSKSYSEPAEVKLLSLIHKMIWCPQILSFFVGRMYIF